MSSVQYVQNTLQLPLKLYVLHVSYIATTNLTVLANYNILYTN